MTDNEPKIELSPEFARFLTGVQTAAILGAVEFAISHLHSSDLDFGLFDGITKRVILTLLGKIQAALIKQLNP